MKKKYFLTSSQDLFEKRILVRADMNVPLENGSIRSDFKLKALLPTLNHIRSNKGKIIIATHLGRPQAADPALSTKHLISWLINQGYNVDYAQSLQHAQHMSQQIKPEGLLLLENLRFFPGEKSKDKEIQHDFAHKLAALADVYVNDAFGLLHRSDTSITLLPGLFKPENQFFGLLIKRELENLSALTKNPKKPFVCVLGGSKLETKLPLIEALRQAPAHARPDYILLGGRLGVEMLKHGNKPGACSIILPHDLLTITQQQPNQPTTTPSISLQPEQTCVDIGPEAIKLFTQIIARAGTIFTNGTMGIYEHSGYEQGTKKILEAIAKSSAHSVIGGGDAVAAAHAFNVVDKISFLSTGGGATLAFLSSRNPWIDLPGLAALKK